VPDPERHRGDVAMTADMHVAEPVTADGFSCDEHRHLTGKYLKDL
jgi:hypothetical protein